MGSPTVSLNLGVNQLQKIQKELFGIIRKDCFSNEFSKQMLQFYQNILLSIFSSPEPELIVYQWSVVRPLSASSTMLKHLLLRNRLADQSQILCGASLGRGNNILFAASGSHDQDGRHAHIWSKPFKNLLLQNRRADFHETWYVASGTPAHHSLFK